MSQNIKMIIIKKNKKNKKIKKNKNFFFKREKYSELYKEFEFNTSIQLYGINYIFNKINNIIINNKYILIIFIMILIIYLKRYY